MEYLIIWGKVIDMIEILSHISNHISSQYLLLSELKWNPMDLITHNHISITLNDTLMAYGEVWTWNEWSWKGPSMKLI